MSLLESILLGIIQGFTEFLPISSSGHLILFQHLMGHKDVPLIFLRVRNVDQFKSFMTKLTPAQANVLTGFVFPKFFCLS